MIVEKRLNELNIVLHKPAPVAGKYLACLSWQNLIFVSGKGPTQGMKEVPAGKIGDKYSIKEGYQLARNTGIEILATLKEFLGDLDKIKKVIKLSGYINCLPNFTEHPYILDGCSDLMVEIFGQNGYHSRQVMGVNSLRSNLPLTIDSVFARVE